MHIEERYTVPVLLRQIADGDEKALATLVRLYWKNIYGHALSWLKSAEEAEEITQDVFLKIWHSRDQVTQLDNFENWIFIISRNTILSAVRKKLSRPTFLQEQEMEGQALRPDQWLENRQHYQVLLNGIDLLPEKRQQIFRMSRLEGLTHEQIAERVGIHKDTVAQYIVKAVAFLKSYLREHIGDSLIVIILLGGNY
ncbi:sigma-70 family RNA polymerase sigma factor [Flavitalea sp. BT771]|uniref:RNA polymerase sigma factor n=1 Tax=Flavitalea sp. BT771 TaxID=3063329 RepID=UPI0026E27810|nr:sigma-70 family RNA polymerase sigma factor [Flavitalea sp. BT771]MDO6431814.1 sigma-70 family RNA polymerase sigma factor [Flavitalea sp. BT771]MDV6220723.1 sigma-70 family RNA polymerase sigma factor [Flavitalea sp. BT771]